MMELIDDVDVKQNRQSIFEEKQVERIVRSRLQAYSVFFLPM